MTNELTALVIDDDPPILQLVSRFTEQGGFKTDQAATTQDGLDLLNSRHYHLVFTDLDQNPTGIQVYNAATAKDIETYIMTGGAAKRPDLLTEAQSVAGKNLLTKPLNFSNLQQIIKAAHQKYTI